MLKTFGSKYRCQVRKIKESYVKNGEFTVPYTTTVLLSFYDFIEL